MPIIVAPIAFAHWQTMRPTPPAAAWNSSTVSRRAAIGLAQQVAGRHALQHHGGGGDVVDGVGQLDEAIGGDEPLVGIGAEDTRIGDAVADLEVA